MKIILASQSPRRQELFKIITDDFIVRASDIPEIIPPQVNRLDSAAYLAVKKAMAVYDPKEDALVIGCDTIVLVKDEILEKPKDKEDARRMLRLLSGKTHTVVTGCCIISGRQSNSFNVATQVEFYDLTDDEIDSYIETGEPFDKAGAYGIQGKGALLVKGINGDYFNVVGLPVAKIKRELSQVTDI